MTTADDVKADLARSREKQAKLREHLAKERERHAKLKAAGKVELGGRHDIFRMSTEAAYRASAMVMIDYAFKLPDPKDLAQPCVYLLRHSMELKLKSSIYAAWDIETMRLHLKTGWYTPIDRSASKVGNEHSLLTLLNILTKAVAPLGMTVPERLRTLVTEFHTFEGDHTRWRYPKGHKRPYEDSSFPEVETLELRGWLDRLNEYHTLDEVIREDCGDRDDRTFAEDFYEHAEGCHHALDALRMERPMRRSKLGDPPFTNKYRTQIAACTFEPSGLQTA